MQFVIVSSNPKPGTLNQSVMREIIRGASDGGADVQVLTLEGIQNCKSCQEGSGLCRSENSCAFGKDGFHDAHQIVKQADAICIMMPVDPSDPNENMPGFLERLRRCEFGQFGALVNKPVLVLSFPNGADNSLLSCLEQADLFCRQTGAVIFDYFGVNSWNSDYAKTAAYYSGRAIAYGRKPGETTSRKRLR